ncbi:MAG: hypothetical protein ABJF23_34160, partial [Bryobacteraceae bacterium]
AFVTSCKTLTSRIRAIKDAIDDAVNRMLYRNNLLGRIGVETALNTIDLERLKNNGVMEQELRDHGFYGSSEDSPAQVFRLSGVVVAAQDYDRETTASAPVICQARLL